MVSHLQHQQATSQWQRDGDFGGAEPVRRSLISPGAANLAHHDASGQRSHELRELEPRHGMSAMSRRL